MNEAGQIELPDSLRSLFGLKPGLRVRAEVTEGRIVIVKENGPVVMDGELENGVLVLPRLGIKMDAVASVRADHLVQPETLAATSCYDIAHELAGSLKKLPKDLATNPQFMENFGR